MRATVGKCGPSLLMVGVMAVCYGADLISGCATPTNAKWAAPVPSDKAPDAIIFIRGMT